MYGNEGTRRARLAVTFARRRQVLLLLALCIWGAVWARAIQLQLVADEELRAVALGQSDRRVTLPARRGEILDREGRLLAINVAARSYFAYPDSLVPARELAQRFAPLRGMNARAVSRDWQERQNKFTWMIRRCNTETSELIENWELPGVYPTWEYQRVYPHVLPGFSGPIGFVNDTMGGAAGLELFYNDLLRGEDGEGVFVADATGRRFAVDPIAGSKPVPGARLKLTIDARWQSILGEELMAAVETWKAKSGMGLIMNPHTGGIIAMVDVDPSRSESQPILKSRLITDVFEPGSTFKLVPFSGAFMDGDLQLHQYFDGCNGMGYFNGRPIKDDKKHGVLSTEEAFVLSSNIVTGRIANRMEPGRLDFWVRRFGFGQKTGIDLPGESPGRIAQQQNSEFNIAQRSFGHGISITALQLVRAYAVIANGGYLVQPHLLESIENPDGTVTPTPVKGERILAPEVALLMKRFARGVVERGTAKAINDSIFVFAGKTGTAEKPDPVTKSYNKNKYMASFVGYYPADNPQIVGLVILDEPEPIHYGGLTSAPVLLNTVRRAASSGDIPASDMSKFAQLYDTAATELPDWSDRLVATVAPYIITTTIANAADETSGNLQNSSRALDTRVLSGCVSGWDRLLSCAQKVRDEKDKARLAPAPAPEVPAPVAEEAPVAVPESDPIAVHDNELISESAQGADEDERP